MKRTCILGIVLALSLLIQGCAVGTNSVLFATRSNIGFDADTAPPNLEIAISRFEGVLEPTFEGGQTVPVMASFSTEARGFANFFGRVRSTFSTGEAAFTMSYLYDSDTPAKATQMPYERVTLSEEPRARLLWRRVRFLQPGKASNVKPVLFGTDTNLGLKVRWTGQTAQLPSSVNLGFKRKEAALAPVSIKRVSTSYEVDVASLLATIDLDVNVPDQNATLTYLQYFATGSAASLLARQKAVRMAMLKRADPSQELQKKKALAGKELREENRKLIYLIRDQYKAKEDKQDEILTEAKNLNLADENATKETLLGQLSDLESKKVTESLRKLADFASDP